METRTRFGGIVDTSSSNFQQTGTASTHRQVAYHSSIYTVGIVIIRVCVTNITSNIHLNNAT